MLFKSLIRVNLEYIVYVISMCCSALVRSGQTYHGAMNPPFRAERT